MMTAVSVLGIFCAVIFMAAACFRGRSMYLIAPLAAMMVLLSSGDSLGEGMLGTFAQGVGDTMASFFLIL